MTNTAVPDCISEHPEYSGLTCHLVKDHKDRHFASGHSWDRSETDSAPGRMFSVRRGELSVSDSLAGLEAGWVVWEDSRIIADGFDTRREARAWVSDRSTSRQSDSVALTTAVNRNSPLNKNSRKGDRSK